MWDQKESELYSTAAWNWPEPNHLCMGIYMRRIFFAIALGECGNSVPLTFTMLLSSAW